jgi:hypothetical protein
MIRTLNMSFLFYLMMNRGISCNIQLSWTFMASGIWCYVSWNIFHLLKMEPVRHSATSVTIYQLTQCHIWVFINYTVLNPLTLSLLMSHIYGAPSKARHLTYIYGRDFLLGILLLEPCISLIYAWKTNKYTNYSLSLLIVYGSSYMFRHYIAIIRERS